METDKNDTPVVTPEISQSDVDHIHEATTSSFFIPEGNNISSKGVENLFHVTPLGGVDPIDVP